MKAEIITIGDEILIGQTLDTNSSWIARELDNMGIAVHALSTVPDEAGRITGALELATGRSDLVIMTGGLGPTSDDITKQTLCSFFGTRLVRDESVLAHITAMLGSRGGKMNENNMGQAFVPEGCRVLKNDKGTAPGMWFDHGAVTVVSLPGVPFEMVHLMSDRVLPLLRERGVAGEIMHRNIMTTGMAEALLAEMLRQFEAELPPEVRLAYLPSAGVIKLRLTARYEDAAEGARVLDEQAAKLRSVVGDIAFAGEEITLGEAVARLLHDRGLSIATAESCTGGNIGRMLTSVPGASVWYRGGIIAYSNDLKQKLLGVNTETLNRYGAVSRECAVEMAEGVRRLAGSDLAVATTGIAGPSGGSESKPVGTLFIAVADELGTVTHDYVFSTDRQVNIRRFTMNALNMVRKRLTGLV